jgi:hypothetical protein
MFAKIKIKQCWKRKETEEKKLSIFGDVCGLKPEYSGNSNPNNLGKYSL